ncbi:Hypothetical predicted protein [Scomber scombrus]|uniref:Uncharacterized protein n=1 Tax=Scomber scombrus TaxID=13677 RepID=A0AAV1PD19_SCOSC
MAAFPYGASGLAQLAKRFRDLQLHSSNSTVTINSPDDLGGDDLVAAIPLTVTRPQAVPQRECELWFARKLPPSFINLLKGQEDDLPICISTLSEEDNYVV